MMQCSFIQQYLVLSPEQCHEFIEAFTNDIRQEPGMIGLDYIDPTKKASTDIKAQFLKEEFEQYNNIITKPLQAAVEEYITTYGLQEQPEFTIHDAITYNITKMVKVIVKYIVNGCPMKDITLGCLLG